MMENVERRCGAPVMATVLVSYETNKIMSCLLASCHWTIVSALIFELTDSHRQKCLIQSAIACIMAFPSRSYRQSKARSNHSIAEHIQRIAFCAPAQQTVCRHAGAHRE